MTVEEWKDTGVFLYSYGDGTYVPSLDFELPYDFETDGENLPYGTIMMCHHINRKEQIGYTVNMGTIEHIMQEQYSNGS